MIIILRVCDDFPLQYSPCYVSQAPEKEINLLHLFMQVPIIKFRDRKERQTEKKERGRVGTHRFQREKGWRSTIQSEHRHNKIYVSNFVKRKIACYIIQDVIDK